MKKSNVNVIERKTVFQGYFQVDEYKLRHKRFEGGMTDVMTRRIFERGHSSIVLLYDPDLDQVVLIKQFRLGALAAIASPWFPDDYFPLLIEAVAGIIDEGKTPEDIARREVIEETGCELLDLITP
jgi:ADP-ribose pyrophosphatase